MPSFPPSHCHAARPRQADLSPDTTRRESEPSARARDNGGIETDDATTQKQTRRHGAELEAAILDAAWEQLLAEGFERFTIDAVAARAQTSKPVLYRRWKTRDDLLHATIRHRGAQSRLPVPDTGTLRGDLLALLAAANNQQSGLAALLSGMLGSYYNQTGRTPAKLREEFIGNQTTSLETVINRGIERGEIDPDRLTPRIINLPGDLFRHEILMTLKPVPDHVIRQIVDDIFIPLVSPRDDQ